MLCDRGWGDAWGRYVGGASYIHTHMAFMPRIKARSSIHPTVPNPCHPCFNVSLSISLLHMNYESSGFFPYDTPFFIGIHHARNRPFDPPVKPAAITGKSNPFYTVRAELHVTVLNIRNQPYTYNPLASFLTLSVCTQCLSLIRAHKRSV